MQETDHTNDFDLEVRSMLQDASEEVPAGVWDDISSTLDRHRHTIIVRRWAAGACAAAAAIALAVIAGRTSFGESAVNVTTSETVSEQLVAQSSVQDNETAETEPETNTAQVSVTVHTRHSIPTSYNSNQGIVSDADQTATTDNHDSEPETASQEETKNPVTTEKKAAAAAQTDPFAEMADDDDAAARHAGHLDFNVSGNIANNDRNLALGGIRSGSQSLIAKAPSTTGIVENSSSVYGIPLSFGIGARYWFNYRIGIGADLQYSLLTRTFNGVYTQVADDGTIEKSVNSEISHRAQYIGIPVNVYFNILSTDDIRFYIYGGGAGEKCISNTYKIYNEPSDIVFRQRVNNLQWSVGAGVGVEYKISQHLGLYIDPSARYYFDCNQPKTVRSDKKYMLQFEAGLRFNL